jgi:predicted Zn-dependent peptidase
MTAPRRLAFPAALALALALGAPPAGAQAPAIPKRPEALTFKPLAFEPPSPTEHRVVLKNGMVVFIAEDRALPLVNVALTIRTGSYLDPKGKEGLAALTGSQIRRGGTKELSADALDERLDFLAAQASSGMSDTVAGAGLNTLTDNLDESLRIFVSMLKEPRFQADRLELAREQALQEMKRRNDDASSIEASEFRLLLYGEDHFSNRLPTEASLRAITREDLVAFHRTYYHPANMIAAVSGSFARAEMLEALEAAFAGWPGTPPTVPPVPSDVAPAAPGVYRVQKDVNQGRVSIGLPSVRRDHPDVYALEVMNEILGGGGFSSRITQSVRSSEGLAYSAGSGVSFGVYYPGRFRAGFQSKSRSVPYATSLVLAELRKMREAPPTAAEVSLVQSNLVATFPSFFASPAQTMSLFASDEYTGRDPSYWKTYRERIRAVTPAEVHRVAREHLPLDRLLILVVGNQQEIDAGDGAHEATLAALAPGGQQTTLSLRDPMTLKRPAAN